jgi:hypothetical protein
MSKSRITLGQGSRRMSVGKAAGVRINVWNQALSNTRQERSILFDNAVIWWESIPSVVDEWVWCIGGMVLTAKNRITRRKPCPSAALYTTNPTRNGPGSNLCLQQPPDPSSASWPRMFKFPKISFLFGVQISKFRRVWTTFPAKSLTVGVLMTCYMLCSGTGCVAESSSVSRALLASVLWPRGHHFTADT